MKKSIAIIGGGSAALMLASQLDENKFDVTIYERNAALGRKFLVAGDGGFNLTHSEESEQFISRYTPSVFFEKIISGFSNTDLRNWLSSIGIETFIGTSKRVFPVKGIKPIDVLNAILNELKKKNVTIKTNHL
ncbi:MAG: NAD(P)/FAD-dependent oxidoreductase, partial [Bacteroidia bacterium]